MNATMQDEPRLLRQFLAWKNGIEAEVRFWDRWMETRGLQWKAEFEERLQFRREFPVDRLRSGVADPETVAVLDVGAGPVTVLGNCIDGREINLIPCDPLGDVYSQLARKHGLEIPVRTQTAFAEDLSCFFQDSAFDLVHCQNALDHSLDPIRGIWEMLRVSKPLGRVMLLHSVNEAEWENYSGFHQWNFDERDGAFVIWNRDESFNVTKMLAHLCEISTFKHDRSINVIIDKRADFELPEPDYKGRVRDLLKAFFAVSYHNFTV